MTTLQDYVRLAAGLPVQEAARRGAALGLRAAYRKVRRLLDQRGSTYLLSEPASELTFRMHLATATLPEETKALLLAEADHTIAHEFDILGSGRVQVRHGMACRGIEDVRLPAQPELSADSDGAWLLVRAAPGNRAECQRIWRLINSSDWKRPDYQPIDWQIDIRSGYRWSELSYYSDIRIGPTRGADIKLPWELARMQHLPRLALAARLGEARAAAEIRAQILDFIACNPPRYGVNWKGVMDVAIRAVNWLVALGIMHDGGCNYDPAFRAVVARSILEHGQHVLQHLEWSEEPRSNHYLADITGLLFIAAHLTSTRRTEGWLGFAVREFTTELQLQFHPDGGNYEASTGYHRLSAEMALFGSALILGFNAAEQERAAGPQPRLRARPPQSGTALPVHLLPQGMHTLLPASLWPLLERMAEFTADIQKPDGRPILIGDQDSGRLLMLDPATAAPHDHRGLLRLAAALFDRSDLTAVAGNPGDTGLDLEGQIVRALARERHLPTTAGRFAAHARRAGSNGIPSMPEGPGVRHLSVPLPNGAAAGLLAASYPEFGLYILRSERLFCALRCFDPSLPGIWGHSHDDNLALELMVDGVAYSSDPGTYVYTSLPEYRDRYRAAEAHFCPRPAGYRALQTGGPFTASHTARGHCRYFGPHGLSAILTGPNWTAERTILIGDSSVDIYDTVSPGTFAPPLPLDQRPTLTDGYGCKTARPARLL